MAALLTGCSAPPPAPSVQAPNSTQAGETAKIPGRIVSLTPNLTEILFALGAGKRIVGVTRNDSYPPEVKSLPKVGGMEVDWEGLLRLKPDVTVLDSELNKDQLARLQQLGLKTSGFRSQSLKGLREAVTGLAAEVGEEARGKVLLAELDSALAGARTRAQGWRHRPKVLVEIWGEPLMTAGGKTYVDEVISAAGADNACAAWVGEYPTISTEKLLELDPEVIILITLDVEKARNLPGWSSLQAVKTHRVFKIAEDLMVRPTLRLPKAVAQIQDWIEPKP